MGVESETWNAFERRWDNFCRGSGIGASSASSQLFQCAADALGDALLKSDPTITSKPVNEVMAAMKLMAIIPVSRGVKRAELVAMQQSPVEAFRTFAARVRGKADTCAFLMHTTCECGVENTVNYTDETIRDVLLTGIADLDIRREALGVEGSLLPTTNDVIGFVEGREMARNALPSHSVTSAMSSFKRGRNNATARNSGSRALPTLDTRTPSTAEKAKQAPCPDCRKTFFLFKETSFGWNRSAHERCKECFLANRRRHGRRDGGYGKTSMPAEANVVDMEEPFSQVSTITTPVVSEEFICRQQVKQGHVMTLQHHIFTKGEWRRAKFTQHPTVSIRVSIDGTAIRPRRLRQPPCSVEVDAVTDSGAQSDVWSLKQFLAHGFSHDDLHPVSMNLRAANKSRIVIDGAFFGILAGHDPQGVKVSCRTMIYVSRDVHNLFLSHDSLLALGILPLSFPTIGDVGQQLSSNVRQPCFSALHAANDRCSAEPKDVNGCGCPVREAPPSRPSALPFACSAANNDKMREWLLQRYASSTFNTCPHQLLPTMDGPPVEIHLDDSATPRACHTASPIPVHWQDKVHEDLLRDEALGVIERVPYGEPTSWCHRMVITRKHDGRPRRTVDLSPLNRYCQREPFAADSPFHLARRVPGNTWKTVTDAWNGYHSAPLRQSDRHLTTFITPFGRWRYCRAPQGYLSSGDGYNRRFDAILSDFERKQRCVDDTVYYDDNLEAHWWRTFEFLHTVGNAGMVLNPEKFQFAKRTVNFAGFRISEATIEPLPKYLDAIRQFPTPTSTTDIRSWFGLVNQVANYAQLRDFMALFKPFLSPKHKFSWTDELDQAFNDSKNAIIEAIKDGVRIFDMSKPTCLRTDWSLNGIGYFLLQKHCECSSQCPDCCPDGWRIVLAGSRFLSGAESRYAPIEGEALAIAWGLEQTRFFSQGCDDLRVITDHKPLVKIFGDRGLDEIANPRLFRLKQRTLLWRFSIFHMPGITNTAADAISRHPSLHAAMEVLSPSDEVENVLAAAIHREASDISALPWSRIVYETQHDEQMRSLMTLIDQGFHDSDKALPHAAPFWQFREALYISDGAVLFEDRVVIPISLRPIVLENLHAAHQGVSSMEQRARAIVFWPGMTADIHAIRAACIHCNQNAPSQPSLPATSTSPPSTPFESVYADFFEFAGHHYLVIGDRLSGWSEVFACPTGSINAGAAGLIRCLRSFFATFGVPEEFSSDGGPEFVAGIVCDFFRRWGVKHRISSAYNPQSNGRAEVAVKATKRLMRSNVNPNGTLDSDRFLRALLQQRNTPDPDCNVSPAQVVFGKPLRDSMSFANRLCKFSNPHIRPAWREAWSLKESSLRTRYAQSQEALNTHSRPALPLSVGDRCFVQNGAGNHPKRWDRTGTVTEVLDHHKYCLKIDGSGRVTTRNRKYLRRFVPVSTNITMPAPSQERVWTLPLPPPASCAPELVADVKLPATVPSLPLALPSSSVQNAAPATTPDITATPVAVSEPTAVILPPITAPLVPFAPEPQPVLAGRPRRKTRQPDWFVAS
jgi:hypothetical protein